MHPRPKPAIAFLLVFPLLVALPSAQVEQTVHESGQVVQLLDISDLAAGEIDAVLRLQPVEGWVEFGDLCVLVGDGRLDAALSSLLPHAGRESVPGGRDDLLLARLDAPGAATGLPGGARVLAGLGRYAVVLVSMDAARELGDGSVSGIAVEPMPWNTALIRRSDRAFPPGEALAATSPMLEAALQAVDLDLYTQGVTDLVAFGPRVTTAASFPAVTSHLEAELQALGFAVTLDPFSISGKTRHNVIAEIQGDLTPDDVTIVCGHYDSVSVSPGADDNASGAAAVVEIARVLRQYRFDSTLRFICFAGEEQGLVGSNAYVNDLVASGEIGSIQGVINMDMIAYLNTSTWDVLLEGKAGTSQPMLALLASIVPDYTSLTSFVSTNPYGSDHIPFINKGINAVLTIEYEDWFNPHYHTGHDDMRPLTLPFAVEIVKMNVAAAAVQAGIQGGYMLEYGAGLAGSGGFVPRLSVTGSSNLGEALSLLVEDGLGGAPGTMIVGSASASLPLSGGTLLVDPAGAILWPAALSGPAGTPGAGTLQLDATVPADPTLTGVSAYLQFGFSDAGAVAGRSLSNGLEIQFGI